MFDWKKYGVGTYITEYNGYVLNIRDNKPWAFSIFLNKEEIATGQRNSFEECEAVIEGYLR